MTEHPASPQCSLAGLKGSKPPSQGQEGQEGGQGVRLGGLLPEEAEEWLRQAEWSPALPPLWGLAGEGGQS